MAIGDKQDRCPNCGYCPHCGQSYTRGYYPYQPYPYYPTWVGGTGFYVANPINSTMAMPSVVYKVGI